MITSENNLPEFFVSQLKLVNFRCYQSVVINLPRAGQVVAYGNNGSGKTSLLEAISLLVSSRGMRHATASEISRHQTGKAWQIDCQLSADGLNYSCSTTGLSAGTSKRSLLVEGKKTSFTNLLKDLQILWLTPAMDRILLESRSQRRNFIDYIIAHFDPSHKTSWRKYEKLQQERLKLLLESSTQNLSWLESLERSMAELSVQIANNRVHWSSYINQRLVNQTADFPSFTMTVDGYTEGQLAAGKNLGACTEDLASLFAANRDLDQQKQRTSVGAARADFLFTMANRNLAVCSTGEQKVLLLSFILHVANLLKKYFGRAPIILLDEVANNLDNYYRNALYRVLAEVSSQVWLTGTDKEVFAPLFASSAILELKKENETTGIQIK